MSNQFKILWRVDRADPDPFVSEGFVQTDEGVIYTATRSPDHAAADMGLAFTSVPHPDAAAAIAAHPGAMEINPDDVIPINKMPLRTVIKNLDMEDPVYDQFLVGEEWWEFQGLWIPMSLPELATWSNGNMYDFPGGDRYMNLRGVKGVYVVYDDGDCRLLDKKFRTHRAAISYFNNDLVPEPEFADFAVDEAVTLDEWVCDNLPDITLDCDISQELNKLFRSEVTQMITNRLRQDCTPVDFYGRELFNPDWLGESLAYMEDDVVAFIDNWIESHGLVRY